MTVTDDVPRKATLFCPECAHEGHLATDWSHRRDGEGRRVVCPDCGATVATRSARASEGAPGERAGDGQATAYEADATAAWRRACRSWLAVWTP